MWGAVSFVPSLSVDASGGDVFDVECQSVLHGWVDGGWVADVTHVDSFMLEVEFCQVVVSYTETECEHSGIAG